MIAKIAERQITGETVAISDVKRLSFAFPLDGNTNTFPKYLDAVTEAFEAFDNARDKNLTPDCIALNFETASDRPIDLARLYPQLENFLDPFVTRKYHRIITKEAPCFNKGRNSCNDLGR